VVPPDHPEVVAVDAAEFDVGEHRAGRDHAVGPHGEVLPVTAAAGEVSALRRCQLLLPVPGLLHVPPAPGFRQRSRHGVDPSVVFLRQSQERLHGDHPLFRGELDHLGVFPAKPHGPCRIGPEGGKSDVLQEQFCDALEVADIFPVDRHAHCRADAAAPKGHEALHGLRETPPAPHGVVALRHGAVDGDLDVVAALRRDEKVRHVVVDQRPVAQDLEAHPVADDPPDDLLQVLADEGLAPGHRHLSDGAATQFLEEPEPLRCREVTARIACALVVVAVAAPQVAAVRDVDVDLFGGAHQAHKGTLESWSKGMMEYGVLKFEPHSRQDPAAPGPR